jgi:sterol desaturase/sphingolipid hydroxylase (fatty acid hydroxylase superfamily)
LAVWGAVAFVLIAALETWRQRNSPDQNAHRWATNLSLFGLEQAFNVGWVWVLGALTASVAGASPLSGWADDWPGWVRVIAAVVLLDATAYFAHVVSHHLEPLWRLHAVHHADRILDVTTTIRHHPLSIVPTGVALGLCAWLFDLPLAHVTSYAALTFVTQSIAHADLGLPGGAMRVAGLVLVTPHLHALHHSRIPAETNSNYGQMLSVWDRMFGTLVHPRPEPVTVGLDTYASGRFAGLLGALGQPFRRPDGAPATGTADEGS